jgi:hypothetical protein
MQWGSRQGRGGTYRLVASIGLPACLRWPSIALPIELILECDRGPFALTVEGLGGVTTPEVPLVVEVIDTR